MHREFPGAAVVRDLVLDTETGLLAFTVDQRILVFDTRSSGFREQTAERPPVTSRSMCVVAEGQFAYGSGKSIVTFDVSTGATERVVDAPDEVTNLVADSAGNVYCSAGAHVFHVRF
jgi:hypothetical protein